MSDRFLRFGLLLVLMTAFSSCGSSNTTATSSSTLTGIPAVSVKCGDQACVK